MNTKEVLPAGRAWCWVLGWILVLGTAGEAWGQALPDGEGKEVVEEHCTVCHGTSNFTGSRFSKEDWEYVVNDMIDRGALINEDEAKIIVNYLTAHFGPEDKSKGDSKSSKSYGIEAGPDGRIAAPGLWSGGNGSKKSLIQF